MAILAMGCAMVLIWTGSRGMVITTAVVVAAVPLIAAPRYRNRPKRLRSAALVALILGGTVWLIPDLIRNLLVHRFSAAGLDRLDLWRYYAPLIMKNPLGFGLNFTGNFTIARPGRGDPIPPHSILDIAMVGGIGAVIVMCFLVWTACRLLTRVVRTQREPLDAGVLVAILVLWIGGSIFEGAPITHPGFWCLLGLAFGRSAESSRVISLTAESTRSLSGRWNGVVTPQVTT